MRLTKINIPREKLLKNKGSFKIKNIQNIEISENVAGRIADILSQDEGISIMHKERQASLLRMSKDKGTNNA